MANYPVDPNPHVPTGMQVIPPGPLRTQRIHVFLGGDFPLFADDWAVATLTPEPEDGDFLAVVATIGLHLHDLGIQMDDMADVDDNIQEDLAVGHHAAPVPMAAPATANGNLSPQHPLIIDNYIPVPKPEQEPDAITQLTKLINKLMENEVEHELIHKLAGNQINGTTINLEETEVNGVEVLKCSIEISIVPANYAVAHTQTVTMQEIQAPNTGSDVAIKSEPANFSKQKKKQPAPRDVSLVRRSRRIASEAAGYKDKESADATQCSKKIIPINLGSQFDAVVDRQGAIPPELPLDTVQAIGTNFCQIPPEELSAANLNYESSDE
ncbi:hypothetical protein QYE76_055905 [Lolium multiflorum]|uniref:Uncharacterized protein n=1 Tax=Lolium multiflorum TaxID=4521 RepID=A0AAD8T1X7_LOLMU|nr:hypothetical protein QYE76_055905 [Lolium multiflorum]